MSWISSVSYNYTCKIDSLRIQQDGQQMGSMFVLEDIFKVLGNRRNLASNAEAPSRDVRVTMTSSRKPMSAILP